ncbi:MAG: hypothetical protein LLF76_07880 [Planctomycetaceae bacterium]|nr:hypothetical protein [Planctomycetaceae bacterium]
MRYRFVTSLMVVTALSCVTGCKEKNSPIKDAIYLYSFMVGNQEIDQTESQPYKMHEALNHGIIVFINDNPIEYLRESSTFVVNPYVKPGENVINSN